MKAMVLHKQGQLLQSEQVDKPLCGKNQVLVRISACGVCRTDLHVCDGDLDNPKLPLIPGHEIVGYIEDRGSEVRGLQFGQRVGVPWLGSTCGHCFYCRHGMENLCDAPGFTGYQIDGGYAEYTVANQHFVFPLDMSMDDVEVAPLLCAGLIGFRSYRMAGECDRLGVYGFGAAAHIITQIAIHQGVEVYAFTREGDTASQEFARTLGVTWAGNSGDKPPKELDACIIYAPVGELVPLALKVLRKGGVLVCAGIHMSDIPTFPYASLWGERVIRSVANLTRRDGEDYFKLLKNISVHTSITPYKLEDANSALADLREGKLQGAAVLVPAS
jgi:propanol-preferring alcohol dehydrogenase